MASAKIATLLIRTIAKPISSQIKRQAKEHERFRNFCVSLAQLMYRTEVRLRTGILGEPPKHIRPLSETKAIDSGANALAEGFLFSVAAGLILGESYRSLRNETKRRDGVDERLGVLEGRVGELEREVELGKERGRRRGREGKDDASQNKNS
ncbi:MAG: optic atrophy 3-like protein [Lentinula lateritia]|nr:MAG: optic atrophy 3-like protein [Lentinula lateritia]